jgi:RNA polymerase sigma-70 factor (ECF subfamily)
MRGAPKDFRTIIERHQTMVYSIALRITCDQGTAEEVAQDAFLALYRCKEAMAGDDHLRFWLRRVTTHGAIDALRRRRRQPERDAEEWMEEEHGGSADSSQPFGLEARIEELLQALPEPMRVAIVLRYCEAMTPAEMASMLDQPLATVKSHLQRGLSLLRRKAEIRLKEYVRD